MTLKTYIVELPDGSSIATVSLDDYSKATDGQLQAAKALELAVELIDDLMPGARYVPGLDIGKLNDGLVALDKVMEED
jgi:hypothetical protein